MRKSAFGTKRRAGHRQQLDGDGTPSIVVAPMIDVPAHVVSERTGGATVISGLRPGAVAPDGTVASLKSGVATVLLGVSRGTGLPTKALGRVLINRDWLAIGGRCPLYRESGQT